MYVYIQLVFVITNHGKRKHFMVKNSVGSPLHQFGEINNLRKLANDLPVML